MTDHWTDRLSPDHGVFSISVAAELSGLHPQTLRSYEQEGLITPARSQGGTRLYSTHDIGRLQEIASLAGDGVNVAGMRLVMQMREETAHLKQEIARLRAKLDQTDAGKRT